MKLIIDIPKKTFEELREGIFITVGETFAQRLIKYIENGIPLDKIRAEIQENINYNKKMNYQGIVAGLLLTLDIIDKYRKERMNDTDYR